MRDTFIGGDIIGIYAAGRRIACAHSGTAFTQPDALAYAYNVRSELTNAVAEVDSHYRYSYDFDPIGNRVTSCERGTNTTYAANELNQYTQIDEGNSAISAPPRETFYPEFDADGNQTLVKTATGIWRVTYNGVNRPMLWACLTAFGPIATNGETIAMSYDRMGRRVTKNVECGLQSAECSCFIYNGYLQVYNSHSPTPTLNSNSYIWDPTEPIATRPLVWLRADSAAYYVHDGNKNVSEVISSSGDLAAHYDYAPFGVVIAQRGAFAAVNPWRFSSEFADDDTATVYYNYRPYESLNGRWLVQEPLREEMSFARFCRDVELSFDAIVQVDEILQYGSEYIYANNRPLVEGDCLGFLPIGGYPEWGGFSPWPPYNHVPTKGNCWRYACNDPAKGKEKAKVDPPGTTLPLNCSSIMKGVLNISGVKQPDAADACGKCMYKVLLVIKPGEDYHWYRQDDDGHWSHKRGDMSIDIGVVNPEQDAKQMGYATICGYLCFPAKGIEADRTK